MWILTLKPWKNLILLLAHQLLTECTVANWRLSRGHTHQRQLCSPSIWRVIVSPSSAPSTTRHVFPAHLQHAVMSRSCQGQNYYILLKSIGHNLACECTYTPTHMIAHTHWSTQIQENSCLPGLCILSKSFTERADTTPPRWITKFSGKRLIVKNGNSCKTKCFTVRTWDINILWCTRNITSTVTILLLWK